MHRRPVKRAVPPAVPASAPAPAPSPLSLSAPTEDSPVPSEWGPPEWYVLRLAAKQASPALSADDAAALVALFKSFYMALPCVQPCRENYLTDFESAPFTLAHAADPVAAAKWVDDLDERVKARKRASASSSSASSSGAVAPSASAVGAEEFKESLPEPAAVGVPAAQLPRIPMRLPGAVGPQVQAVVGAMQTRMNTFTGFPRFGVRPNGGMVRGRVVAAPAAVRPAVVVKPDVPAPGPQTRGGCRSCGRR